MYCSFFHPSYVHIFSMNLLQRVCRRVEMSQKQTERRKYKRQEKETMRGKKDVMQRFSVSERRRDIDPIISPAETNVWEETMKMTPTHPHTHTYMYSRNGHTPPSTVTYLQFSVHLLILSICMYTGGSSSQLHTPSIRPDIRSIMLLVQ